MNLCHFFLRLLLAFLNFFCNNLFYKTLCVFDLVSFVVQHVMDFPPMVPVQVGERIRVILDCEDNTLAFERNYEFLGVAFRGLPDKKLYPAISAVYGNTEVSMVYLGHPLDG